MNSSATSSTAPKKYDIKVVLSTIDELFAAAMQQDKYI